MMQFTIPEEFEFYLREKVPSYSLQGKILEWENELITKAFKAIGLPEKLEDLQHHLRYHNMHLTEEVTPHLNERKFFLVYEDGAKTLLGIMDIAPRFNNETDSWMMNARIVE